MQRRNCQAVVFDVYQMLRNREVPSGWKKANVLLIHEKNNRQLKKKYRPIPLLPICGKIFDATYEHLCVNQLLTPSQSEFRAGDSTINQLLSITHKINSAFDEFPSRETRHLTKCGMMVSSLSLKAMVTLAVY